MKIISHRGISDYYKPNSLEAILKTYNSGVDYVEIDVRSTKDNILVLAHDDKLHNIEKNTKLSIRNTSYSSLIKNFDYLTTLEKVLSYKDLKLIIEIKECSDLTKLVNLFKNCENNDLIITSFDYKILKNIHKTIPEAKLAVLDRWSGVRATQRARTLNTDIIIMNYRWIWSGFIKAINRSKFKLIAYTLNNKPKAYRWKRYGLYGVITDFPSEFK